MPLGEIYLPADPPKNAAHQACDAVIIGMCQRFNDQIGQTAQFVREILV